MLNKNDFHEEYYYTLYYDRENSLRFFPYTLTIWKWKREGISGFFSSFFKEHPLILRGSSTSFKFQREFSTLAMKENYAFTSKGSNIRWETLEKITSRYWHTILQLLFKVQLHLRRIKFEESKGFQLRFINILFKFSSQQSLLF